MARLLSEKERFPELFVNTSIDRRKCERIVPLKVVVLGMPRTGTQSIRIALKQLGFIDTYHMDCLFENPPDIDLWRQAFLAKFRGQGRPFEKKDWDQLLGHCQAVTDLPTSAFVLELLAAYPDAKLIITPREENGWYTSCQRTIHQAAMSRFIRTLAPLDTHFLHRFEPLLGLVFGSMFPCHPSLWNKPEGRQTWIDHYNTGHEEARRLVSPDKRLEFLIQEDWAPLCEFLGVQVPLGDDGEPLKFPHIDDTETFGAKLAVVKRQAAVRIAKRWSPLLGIIGVVGMGIWWMGRQ